MLSSRDWKPLFFWRKECLSSVKKNWEEGDFPRYLILSYLEREKAGGERIVYTVTTFRWIVDFLRT